MVNWEVAIGRVRSSCDCNDTEGASSFWHFSNLRRYIADKDINRIRDEYKLEAVRRQYYPDCVSRLTGVYFFEKPDIANAAIDRWNINQSKKSFVTPINFSASNITRIDSEWITNCLGKPNASDDWMHNYWQGKTYGEFPLTEVLASGLGHVADVKLQTECFQRVYDKSPTFAKLAMFGIAGILSGVWGVGQAIPIIGWRDSKLHGNFYYDLRELRGSTKVNWDKALKKAIDSGYKFGNLPNLDIGKDIATPDYGISFEFEFKPDEEFLKLLELI